MYTEKEVKKVELMSPAGSYEALMAGINAGCDSIYFGVEQLNMRARSANNFRLGDLDRIARICGEHKVKSYLTLNTVLYDHDIFLMKRLVDQARESGITAVIAADHAVLAYARNAGVQIHMSTQANITNIDTVAFYAAYADVMVLARELSLKQVGEIVRQIKSRGITGPKGNLVQIEIFAHGALCMAVSGKCYLSLHTDYASANRGACVQNCRRSYIVADKESGTEFEVENEYIMSAKDLCTIGFLDQMMDAGVSVLKIEGRGRAADYVHITTSCYREAIDTWYAGTYSQEKSDAWMQRLGTVYNRGFWDGYYLGRTMGEWNNEYGSRATRKKVFIGRGVNYFDKAGVAEIRMESHQLTLGDEIVVTGPTTGYLHVVVSEMRVNDLMAPSVRKGDIFTTPIPQKIRSSDKIYKLVDA